MWAGAERPALSIPKSPIIAVSGRTVSPRIADARGLRAARIAHIAPMVIVLPNGRVNRIQSNGGNPSEIRIPAISRRWVANGVYAGFIAILKLPFKFDRS